MEGKEESQFKILLIQVPFLDYNNPKRMGNGIIWIIEQNRI
jgi:hypothetical protein